MKTMNKLMVFMFFVSMSVYAQTGKPSNTNIHRIDIRLVEGVAEFYDTINDEKFVPRGNNYAHLAWQYEAFSDQLIFYHSIFMVGLYNQSRGSGL